MKCERCNKEITKEDCPFEDAICEDCCNAMLLSQSIPHDFSSIDFETEKEKKK